MEIQAKLITTLDEIAKELKEKHGKKWNLTQLTTEKTSFHTKTVYSIELMEKQAIISIYKNSTKKITKIKINTAFSNFKYTLKKDTLTYKGAFQGFLKQHLLPNIEIDYNTFIGISSLIPWLKLSYHECQILQQVKNNFKNTIFQKLCDEYEKQEQQNQLT